MHFIDGYIERFKPQAVKVGNRATAYCERILARLDQLVDNTENDEDLRERKARFSRTLTTTGEVVTIGTPTPGRRWKLDFISMRGFGNGGALIILVDGVEVMYVNADDQNTAGGNGLIIQSGEELSVRSAFDTGTTSIYVTGQYTIETRKPRKTGLAGGTPTWLPDDSPTNELEGVSRHSNLAPPGVNVVGPRRLIGTEMVEGPMPHVELDLDLLT